MNSPQRSIVLMSAGIRGLVAMQTTALMLTAVGIADSIAISATLGLIAVLPTVGLGRVCAAAFERLGCRKVISAGLTLNVTAAMLYVALADRGSLFPCFVLASVFGVIRPFAENGVNLAIIEGSGSNGVERLNGKVSAAQAVAGTAAPAVAGTLFALNRVAPLLCSCVLGVLAILCARALETPQAGAPRERHPGDRGQSRLPRPLLVLAIVGLLSNVAAGLFGAAYPILLLKHYSLTSSEYGLCNSLISFGMILANIAFLYFVKHVDSWTYANIADAVRIAALAGLLWWGASWSLALCCIGYGIAVGVWNVGSSSAFLRGARGNERARISAKYRSIVFAGAPIGSAFSIAAQSISVTGVLTIAGGLWITCFLMMLIGSKEYHEAYDDLS